MKKISLLFLSLPILTLAADVHLSSGAGASPSLSAVKVAGTTTPAEIIKIWKMDFKPKRLLVKPGALIRWVNSDSSEHDITSGTAVSGRKARQMKVSKFPDGKFQSGLFGEEQTFEITLNQKGEYAYFCNEHPDMQAVIVVQ